MASQVSWGAGGLGSTISLDERVVYLRDSSTSLSLKEVQQRYLTAPNDFQTFPGRLAAGFDSAVFWFRVDLEGLASKDRLVLDIGRPYLQSVRVYQPGEDLYFLANQQGQRYAPAEAEQAPRYRGAAFYLQVNTDKPVAYVRVESSTTLVMTFKLWEERFFLSHQSHYNLLISFLYGALVMMFFLGCLQFAFTRQKLLLLFAVYQLATVALYFTLHGFFKLYFIQEASVLPHQLIGFFSCLSTGFLILLAIDLLALKKTHLRLHKGMQLFGWAWIAASVLAFFNLYPYFAEQIHQFRLVLIILASGFSAHLAWQGNRVALLFTLSFLPQLLLVGLRNLSLLGLMPFLFEPDTLALWVLGSHLLQVALLTQSINLQLRQFSQAKREMEIAYQKALQQGQIDRQTSQAQREFMGMLAHEFRNPLAIITSVAAILPKHLQDKDPEIQKLSFHLDKSSRKLADLLETCLTEDRLDASLQEVHLCHFSLPDLVKKLQQALAPKRIHFINKGIEKICADPVLLALALRNLLDNALKYSPEDRPVTLLAEKDSHQVKIKIVDQGLGIAPEEQEAIFKRFYRAEKHKTHIQGYGIGLHLVKRILELHSGQVILNSQLGEGATFTLLLPLSGHQGNQKEQNENNNNGILSETYPTY